MLFQSGDYFGQTVNLTARIADYARPGEVLVTQAVANASREVGIAFADIGPVELKGVAGQRICCRRISPKPGSTDEPRLKER